MASNSVILGLTALVFSTWAVSLAGIASVQSSCSPSWVSDLSSINGFSAGLPCMSVFRYYWFIICLEFVLIVGLGLSLVLKSFEKTRQSWLGVFAVATLLYIQTSDAFLSVDSITGDMGGQLKHRVRTLIAGAIMTATVNSFLIIAMGTSDEEAPAAAAAEPEAKPIV